MRLSVFVLLAFAVIIGSLSNSSVAQGIRSQAVASVSAAQDQPTGVVAQSEPSGKLDVDINVNKGGGGSGRWYANPMWIAIGGLALIVLVALIFMAGRGSGGTTVVR
jgi:hypothetical protein